MKVYPSFKVTIDNKYSKEDEFKIIKMLEDGVNYKDIAENLGRTYDGTTDKIRRMKVCKKPEDESPGSYLLLYL